MANLVETFEINQDALELFLLKGDFQSFEEHLYQGVLRFYEDLAEKFLLKILKSEAFISRLSAYQKEHKMSQHKSVFRK